MKNKYKNLLILASLIAIIMFGIFKNLLSKDNEQLKEVLNNDAFLVDVRTPSEFASGSVKGAVNIPLDKLSSQISKFKNKNNIVVFCLSGGRSSQAKNILEQNGIKNITNGGGWKNVSQFVN
jgi:rhodanese-related sulfurtransferase